MNFNKFLTNKLSPSTIKLASSYLAIIMIMSIVFSVVFFATSAHELERKPSAQYYAQANILDQDNDLDNWLSQRAIDSRSNLLTQLLILNAIILIGGAMFSLYLARWTLRPIEKSLISQDRFVADASHELKTPLTSLLLSNEIALRKKRFTEQEARTTIKQNVRDIKELTSLSDSLLDLAVGTSHSLPLDLVSINKSVSEVIARIQPLADAKHITLKYNDDALMALANKTALTKVLSIIIDNAIKYSPENTAIQITAEASDNEVRVLVKDCGYGIKPSDLPHVFERFYRADQSRTLTAGHGLGLAIAQRLVASMGGTLSVESSVNTGSTFTITLRAA